MAEHKPVIGQPFKVYKQCWDCGELKEVRSEFYRDNSAKDGRKRICKKCDLLRFKIYRKYKKKKVAVQ